MAGKPENDMELSQDQGLRRIAGKAARLGGWSLDLTTNTLHWSDEVCAIHDLPAGYQPTLEEGLGYFPENERQHVVHRMKACAEHGTPYDLELPKLTAKGRQIWVRSIGEAVRDSNGRIVRLQGAFQDITQRRNLEEQLRQAQKLEAIGTLAGGIAHDFNNLLMVINSYSEILQDDTTMSSNQRQAAELINRAGSRAATLTRQLLGYSRKSPQKKQALNLNDLVIKLRGKLELMLGEVNTLDTALEPELRKASLDPELMEQVLINLITNARDAMPTGGKVTISTANVNLHKAELPVQPQARPGSYVLLAVTDIGAGIEAELLDKIFDPFFTTKDIGKGSGLGLSMALGIIQQSGGWIEVVSEPGKGSNFRIFCPV